jgi:hypothetical protein
VKAISEPEAAHARDLAAFAGEGAQALEEVRAHARDVLGSFSSRMMR